MPHVADIGTLTIPSGTAVSGSLVSAAVDGGAALSTSVVKRALGSAIDLLLYCPATLPETVVVQISPVKNPASGDWKTLEINGADVEAAAGRVIDLPIGAVKDIRLKSSTNVASDRAFILRGQLAEC